MAIDKEFLLKEVRFRGDTMAVDLWYQRVSENAIKAIEVGLMDVRAADSLRIEYDFERDGYSIKQASRFQWESGDKACDPDWQEVAFIQAWARQEDDEDDGTE